MRLVRAVRDWIAERDNQRDIAGLIGLVLLWIGLDRIYSGAGMATSGAIVVAIAVLVR